jgi:hypothetical protein
LNIFVGVMIGIAILHFSVFVPDRFKGGIVGAFGCAAVGSVLVGLILAGGEVDNASITTALQGIPGALIGLGACWLWGDRTDERHEPV